MGHGVSAVDKADAKIAAEARTLAKEAIRGGEADAEAQVREQFAQWDKDGNGEISVDELQGVMEKMNPTLTKEEVGKLLATLDMDSNGAISLDELISFAFATPYMDQFFQTQKDILRQALQRVHESDKSHKAVEKIQKDMERECVKKLKPLIQQSFKHHDKDGSGVLEPDESALFFASYAEKLALHIETTQELNDCLCAVGADSSSGLSLEERIAKTVTRNEFVAKMKTRVQAAFKVVDVNADLRLQQSEMILALTPGCPENAKLMEAFGAPHQPTTLQDQFNSAVNRAGFAN